MPKGLACCKKETNNMKGNEICSFNKRHQRVNLVVVLRGCASARRGRLASLPLGCGLQQRVSALIGTNPLLLLFFLRESVTYSFTCMYREVF